MTKKNTLSKKSISQKDNDYTIKQVRINIIY